MAIVFRSFDLTKEKFAPLSKIGYHEQSCLFRDPHLDPKKEIDRNWSNVREANKLTAVIICNCKVQTKKNVLFNLD